MGETQKSGIDEIELGDFEKDNLMVFDDGGNRLTTLRSWQNHAYSGDIYFNKRTAIEGIVNFVVSIRSEEGIHTEIIGGPIDADELVQRAIVSAGIRNMIDSKGQDNGEN